MRTKTTNNLTKDPLHFERALQRLKNATGLYADCDVAALLQLPQSTFATRKCKNSFPQDALRSLILRQPWQDIDLEFIMTGRKSDFEQINQRFKSAAGLTNNTQVYRLLGISGDEFAVARLNNLFPITALYNLISTPAGKGIDLDYVISGKSVTVKHYGNKLIEMLDKLAILPEELQSPIIESVNLVYDLYKKSTNESPCSN